MLSLALAWAVAIVVRPFPLLWCPALIVSGVPVLCGLLQLAIGLTAYRWATWNSLLGWTVNLTLFGLALQFGADASLCNRFLKLLLFFGFGLSVVSVVQMFTSGGLIFWLFPSGYSDFVLGPFVYHNQYAAFMELILPLALYRALHNPQTDIRYWLMAAVMVASVVAGASRTGTMVVIAECILIIVLAGHRGVPGGAIGSGSCSFPGSGTPVYRGCRLELFVATLSTSRSVCCPP